MRTFSKYFVSLLGIGYIPYAPGTFGSVFAIIIWYLSLNLFSINLFYIVFLFTFLISFKITQIYLDITKKDDPPEVIIDEFLGQSIPLLFILDHNIFEILLVFSAFRIFDIFKFYPINRAEKLDGAKGVIMDDLIAGVYSLIILMIYKIFILFL